LDPSIGQAGIRGARGFVPNFSAVAGEIAASRGAGYKSPVTPGQVKTMNIPGAGKAAYNTQESVFKMPGVVQPFIRPPKTSDAAPSYAKEVKKKYNFNPYQNAAGGFVPHFKGAVDTAALERAIGSFNSGAGEFNSAVGKFESSVNDIDFSLLQKAAKEMSGASKAFTSQYTVLADAASRIKEGADKIADAGDETINLKPLSTAAGQFTKGMASMAGTLAKPLSLNTDSLEKAMKDLLAALGSIQGEIKVTMPEVTVNVQGLDNLDLSPSTKLAIADDVERIVGQEIEKKTPGIVKDVLS
jgi:Tfp pilus assembly major pilin PilA